MRNYNYFLLVFSNYSFSGCEDVIKLSVIYGESVQSEKSFLDDASDFCKEYSEVVKSGKGVSGNLGYGGFSLGASSASTDAKSIAEKICSSRDMSKVREKAYKTYIKFISPQAYGSYDHCISNNVGIGIDVSSRTEIEASILVSYKSQDSGKEGSLLFNTDFTIECIWKNEEEIHSKKIVVTNGDQFTLSCSRKDSTRLGFINIYDSTSIGKNSRQNIPWAAYKDGVPVSLSNAYSREISEIKELKNSLKGAVVAFNKDICPKGFKPYEKAYGRFVRGVDRSGKKIDPSGKRDIGSIQDDKFKSHRHPFEGKAWGFEGAGANNSATDANGGRAVYGTKSVGGEETRPKNVALLYFT